MKKSILPLAMGLLGLTLSQSALADVSGMVYQDLPVNGTTLNTYGVKDANELGVAGVTVTAYQADGTSQSMVTADDGLWTLATTGDVRVEFSTIPAYLKESPDGGSENSSVRFVTNGSATDFAVHDPDDFSDTPSPKLVTSSWVRGLANSSAPALHRFNYTDEGQNSADAGFNGNNPGPAAETIATFGDIGTTWGIAYQKNQQRYFVSTVVKRHAEMANGVGYIYVFDNSGAANPMVSFDVNGRTTTDGSTVDLGQVCRGGGCENDVGYSGVASHYQLYSDPTQASYDIDAAAKTGKASFGAIDMQPNTNNLWAVNLNQRALMRIDVSNPLSVNLPGDITQYPITSLPGIPTCIGGEIRPWALKFSYGKGYLGVVCDGSLSGDANNLSGHVLSFDPDDVSTGFVEELNVLIPLQVRVFSYSGFKTWSEDWNDFDVQYNNWGRPQPIISDIEFNAKGDMTIGVIDRGNMILGTNNYSLDTTSTNLVGGIVYGDIYHACKTSNGFEYEGNGTCPTHFATGQGYNGGEFYDDRVGDNSPEGSEGALALLKGSNVVATVMMDPRPDGITGVDFHHSQGVNFLNTTSGSISRYYSVNYSGDYSREFGKAHGMGDIELLTPPAPIEIGNRVWDDTNSNGIQDAGEVGIANITVELLDTNNTVLATATTDTNGVYIFSNDPNGVSTASHIYNIAQLVPNKNYKVSVPNISGGGKQVGLGANNLTIANTGEGANSNQNDSDGIASGNNAEASISAADIRTVGANNHSFDFGFSTVIAPIGCTTINNTASITAVDQTDTDATNDTASASFEANCATPEADLELVKTADKLTVLKGDTLIYTLTLTNKGGSDATDVEVTDTLPANVTFVSATAPAGTSFDDNTKVWMIPSLPAALGSNVVALQIEVTIN